MFSNEYQGGLYVDVFSTQGANPLSQWRITGLQKGVHKSFDKLLKGYVYEISTGVKLQVPKDDRSSLGLVQPYLLIQLELSMSAPFTVELGLTDAGGTRRRLFLSTSFSDPKQTPLHCQVPLPGVTRGTWLNLCLPVAELTRAMFKGSIYRCMDSMSLSGTARLRRIATLKDPPCMPLVAGSGGLPKQLELPSGVDCVTQQLDTASLALVAPAGATPSHSTSQHAAPHSTTTHGAAAGLSPSLLTVGGTAVSLNSTLGRRSNAMAVAVPVGDSSSCMLCGDSSDEEDGAACSSPSATGAGRPWGMHGLGHPPASRMGCNASSNGLSSPGASSSNSSSHMWASPAGQPDSNSGSSSAAPALRPGRRALLAATANAAGAGSESCSSPAASSTHAVEPSGLMGRSGRRTMSAQGVLRTGPPPRAVTSAVSPASSGRGAADAPGQGPVAAPKSPPWPRSVTDVRAQSGPARLSAEALQGLGETLYPGPGDVPMSPSLVPRHRRRAGPAQGTWGGGTPKYVPTLAMFNTITENDDELGSSGTASPPTASTPGGRDAGSQRPAPAAASSTSARAAGLQGGLRSPTRSPTRLRGQSRQQGRQAAVVHDVPSSPTPVPGIGLASLLHIKASMDASTDLIAMASPGAGCLSSSLRAHSSTQLHAHAHGSGLLDVSPGSLAPPGGGMLGPSILNCTTSLTRAHRYNSEPTQSDTGDGDAAAGPSIAALPMPTGLSKINTRVAPSVGRRAGGSLSTPGTPTRPGAEAGASRGTPNTAAGNSPSPFGLPPLAEGNGARGRSSLFGRAGSQSRVCEEGAGPGSANVTPTKAGTPISGAPRNCSPGPAGVLDLNESCTPHTPTAGRRAGGAARGASPSRVLPGSAASPAAASRLGQRARTGAESPSRQLPSASNAAVSQASAAASKAHGQRPAAARAAACDKGKVGVRGAMHDPLASLGLVAAGARHRGPGRGKDTHRSSITEVEVEEDLAMMAGSWGDGFGVDEDDEMLGSRHFRESSRPAGLPGPGLIPGGHMGHGCSGRPGSGENGGINDVDEDIALHTSANSPQQIASPAGISYMAMLQPGGWLLQPPTSDPPRSRMDKRMLPPVAAVRAASMTAQGSMPGSSLHAPNSPSAYVPSAASLPHAAPSALGAAAVAAGLPSPGARSSSPPLNATRRGSQRSMGTGVAALLGASPPLAGPSPLGPSAFATGPPHIPALPFPVPGAPSLPTCVISPSPPASTAAINSPPHRRAGLGMPMLAPGVSPRLPLSPPRQHNHGGLLGTPSGGMPGAGASGVVRGDDLLRDGGSLLFRASMVGPPGARAGSRPATAFGGRDVTGVAHALPCVGSACEEDGWGDAALLGGTSGGLSEYLEERARAYSPPITIALQVSAGSAGLAGPSRFTQPCSVAAGGPGPGPGALLDVAYDTVLNCYVDTHTGQYYELARG